MYIYIYIYTRYTYTIYIYIYIYIYTYVHWFHNQTIVLWIHPSIDDSHIVSQLRVYLIPWFCHTTELDLRGYWHKRSHDYYYYYYRWWYGFLVVDSLHIYLSSVLRSQYFNHLSLPSSADWRYGRVTWLKSCDTSWIGGNSQVKASFCGC